MQRTAKIVPFAALPVVWVDRRGFPPILSTCSTEKGAESFQNGISGRASERRGSQPLTNPCSFQEERIKGDAVPITSMNKEKR